MWVCTYNVSTDGGAILQIVKMGAKNNRDFVWPKLAETLVVKAVDKLVRRWYKE